MARTNSVCPCDRTQIRAWIQTAWTNEFVHATRKLVEIKWKFLYNFSPFPLYPQCLCGKEDVSRQECKEFLNHWKKRKSPVQAGNKLPALLNQYKPCLHPQGGTDKLCLSVRQNSNPCVDSNSMDKLVCPCGRTQTHAWIQTAWTNEFVHATRKLVEIKWKFLYNFSPFPLYPQCLCGKEDVSRRECKEFLNHWKKRKSPVQASNKLPALLNQYKPCLHPQGGTDKPCLSVWQSSNPCMDSNSMDKRSLSMPPGNSLK